MLKYGHILGHALRNVMVMECVNHYRSTNHVTTCFGDAVDTNLDDLDLFPPETLSYSYDMQTLKALLDCYIQATTLQI